MHEMAVTINKNHVVGVALPLFKKGQLMAAIGVYLPDLRFGKSEKNAIIKALKNTAAEINNRMNAFHSYIRIL